MTTKFTWIWINRANYAFLGAVKQWHISGPMTHSKKYIIAEFTKNRALSAINTDVYTKVAKGPRQ